MDPKAVDHPKSFLNLNISGKRYTLLKSTALRLHSSLFSELARLDETRSTKQTTLSPAAASSVYMSDSKEFYLERSSTIFKHVLTFVYTGRLHCPSSVCKELLMAELKFWRVLASDTQDVKVAPCCGLDGQETKTESAEVNDQKNTEENEEAIEQPKTFLRKVWLCCEEPSSSAGASLLSLISFSFILLSVVALVVGTVPALQYCDDSDKGHNNSTIALTSTQPTPEVKKGHECEDGGVVFDIIQYVCIAWFTLELIVRFIVCPNKRQFFSSALNIIDILATVPFYIELILKAILDPQDKEAAIVHNVFRLLRILRVMRVMRLARFSDSIRMMGETVTRCRRDLGVMGVFICMTMVTASSIVYYLEHDEQNTQFTSIPSTFWWCIVTLTTVGYGDMVPTTVGGRICAGLSCIMGIIMLALPLSIVVEQFSQTYKARAVKHTHADVTNLLKRVSIISKKSTKKVQPDKDDVKNA